MMKQQIAARNALWALAAREQRSPTTEELIDVGFYDFKIVVVIDDGIEWDMEEQPTREAAQARADVLNAAPNALAVAFAEARGWSAAHPINGHCIVKEKISPWLGDAMDW
jgi:hypothetical protein